MANAKKNWTNFPYGQMLNLICLAAILNFKFALKHDHGRGPCKDDSHNIFFNWPNSFRQEEIWSWPWTFNPKKKAFAKGHKIIILKQINSIGSVVFAKRRFKVLANQNMSLELGSHVNFSICKVKKKQNFCKGPSNEHPLKVLCKYNWSNSEEKI